MATINTTMDVLYPEFWATAFDEIDIGEYGMQNRVSRKYDNQLANYGDTVNVPIAPDFGDADAWTPGDAISGTAIAQTTTPVALNKSYKKTIQLTGGELSLSPYELINQYGIGMAKSIYTTVNKELYKTALESKYFIDATGGLSEDLISDAGTLLSEHEVSGMNRYFEASPTLIGDINKIDAFQLVQNSANTDIMDNGLVTRRLGFDFYRNNAFAKYTPIDIAGAVNNGAGYAVGATTMVVDGFNDDAMPLKAGDIFVMAADSTSTKHTILSTLTTGSDTTSITFYPGLVESEADDAVINVTATQSAIAYVPSGIALAARAYSVLPSGIGVNSSVVSINGLPIRISVWHDAQLGVKVQYDILFGTKLINDKRVVRLIEDK